MDIKLDAKLDTKFDGLERRMNQMSAAPPDPVGQT